MKFLSCVRLFGIPWCLPSFSVHGIFQAGVPEWVAISFSRGSSWPRDRTPVSHIAGRCFTLWAINGVCYTLLPEIHNLLMHDIALMKRETEAAWAPPGHTCVAWRPAQAGIHSPAHWHLPNCFWSFPRLWRDSCEGLHSLVDGERSISFPIPRKHSSDTVGDCWHELNQTHRHPRQASHGPSVYCLHSCQSTVLTLRKQGRGDRECLILPNCLSAHCKALEGALGREPGEPCSAWPCHLPSGHKGTARTSTAQLRAWHMTSWPENRHFSRKVPGHSLAGEVGAWRSPMEESLV